MFKRFIIATYVILVCVPKMLSVPIAMFVYYVATGNNLIYNIDPDDYILWPFNK